MRFGGTHSQPTAVQATRGLYLTVAHLCVLMLGLYVSFAPGRFRNLDYDTAANVHFASGTPTLQVLHPLAGYCLLPFSLLRVLGVKELFALRLTFAFYFALSALMLYYLLRACAGPGGRLLTFACFLLSVPVSFISQTMDDNLFAYPPLLLGLSLALRSDYGERAAIRHLALLSFVVTTGIAPLLALWAPLFVFLHVRALAARPASAFVRASLGLCLGLVCYLAAVVFLVMLQTGATMDAIVSGFQHHFRHFVLPDSPLGAAARSWYRKRLFYLGGTHSLTGYLQFLGIESEQDVFAHIGRSLAFRQVFGVAALAHMIVFAFSVRDYRGAPRTVMVRSLGVWVCLIAFCTGIFFLSDPFFLERWDGYFILLPILLMASSHSPWAYRGLLLIAAGVLAASLAYHSLFNPAATDFARYSALRSSGYDAYFLTEQEAPDFARSGLGLASPSYTAHLAGLKPLIICSTLEPTISPTRILRQECVRHGVPLWREMRSPYLSSGIREAWKRGRLRPAQ